MRSIVILIIWKRLSMDEHVLLLPKTSFKHNDISQHFTKFEWFENNSSFIYRIFVNCLSGAIAIHYIQKMANGFQYIDLSKEKLCGALCEYSWVTLLYQREVRNTINLLINTIEFLIASFPYSLISVIGHNRDGNIHRSMCWKPLAVLDI